MANFTVNTAASFDFLSIDLFDLFNYNSELKLATVYRFLNDASNFANFTGAGFTYAGTTPDTLTGGTINAFSRTVGGAVQYTFTGLTLSAANFETFRASGDTIGFFGNILGGNDTITGNIGNDILFGVSGDDRLDGKAGADIMYGGTGNDTYVVDNIGDVVSDEIFPLAGGLFVGDGTADTVESSISFTLPFFIEKLVLTGTANIDGTGSLGNETIIGNSGNNVLDGGNGSDILQGGAGNDTYYVDLDTDVVIDSAGFDVVFVKSFSHTMGAGVENGTLLSQGIGLIGNGLANVLTGNDGFNLLSGAGGNDTINGLGSSDQIKGEDGVDTIDGGSGNDFLTGGSGNDVVIGGLGDDFVDYALGGDATAALGADQLTGGLGNDIYRVDNLGDVVTELAGQGFDRVYSSIHYTLTANVEDLYLEGLLNLNGTGNALANKLFGNDGNNTLDGLAGADVMTGGLGNDTYIADNVNDRVLESGAPGTDLVKASVSFRLSINVENLTLTGAANINGTGNNQVNIIIGNTGNNVLDGLAGADNMQGGLGNDIYIVDNGGDVVTDTGGVELVKSSVNYGLSAGIEDLELTGLASISGFGNTLNNKITGNGADNLIDGAANNDILSGGGGNDLIGGGAGNDTIDGGIGNDIINSGLGNDLVTGGAGADRFVFETLALPFDTITDFQHLTDDFLISSAVFGGGLVAAGAVVVTTGPAAVGAGVAQMVYNNATGALIWDTNGSTAGGATQIAQMSNFATLTLTAADFIVF